MDGATRKKIIDSYKGQEINFFYIIFSRYKYFLLCPLKGANFTTQSQTKITFGEKRRHPYLEYSIYQWFYKNEQSHQ